MRVALTALDAAGGTHTDVLVTCDERTTVREVALALQGAPAGAPEPLAIVIRHPRFSEAAAGGPEPHGGGASPVTATRAEPVTLWVDRRPLGAELPAGRALRDGMVVS